MGQEESTQRGDDEFSPQINRSTNISKYYEQGSGSCYAQAASSAYINTCARIYGVKCVPSYRECMAIADYNDIPFGDVGKALKLLEKHFKCGICYEYSTEKPLIKDVLMSSVFVTFTTNEIGWKNVSKGHLLEKPPGEPNGWNVVLVEAYDYENDYSICKKFWGDLAASRINLKLSATHGFYVHKVFFP
jgi:hypothetical protein